MTSSMSAFVTIKRVVALFVAKGIREDVFSVFVRCWEDGYSAAWMFDRTVVNVTFLEHVLGKLDEEGCEVQRMDVETMCV